MRVAPSPSGRLYVVDDSAAKMEQVESVQGGVQTQQAPKQPAVLEAQDISDFSRTSETYCSHDSKKDKTHSSSRANKPKPRVDKLVSRSKTKPIFEDSNGSIAPDYEDVQSKSSDASHMPRIPQATKDRKSIKKHKSWMYYVLISAITIGLVTGLSLGAFMFWNTYLRFDDAADIQGTWYFQEGSVEIYIDEDSINLDAYLEYAYTLDTWAKTISFTFSDLSGQGTYKFSEDRTTLIISEGQEGQQTTLTLTKKADIQNVNTPESTIASDKDSETQSTKESENA